MAKLKEVAREQGFKHVIFVDPDGEEDARPFRGTIVERFGEQEVRQACDFVWETGWITVPYPSGSETFKIALLTI